MKKVLAIVLAVAMMLTVSVVAFADTTVAEQSMDASGTITILDGVDFTDETLSLCIYFTLDNPDNLGWGPAGLCDSAWTTCIGYGTDYDLVTNEEGVISYTLPTIAEAFAAFGSDPADGVVINWWGNDYATLTGVALVSTSDAAAVVEEETAEPEETATEEAPAEETPAEEAPAASTTTTTTSPATGVALCLVPMAIAALGAVASKRK